MSSRRGHVGNSMLPQGVPASSRGLSRRAAIKLRRFLQLPPWKRRLLIRAAVLLALIRASLWLLPFEAVLRLSRWMQGRDRPGGSGAPLPGAPPVDQIARAVRRASGMIPGATCLTQALAGRILLTRAGYPSELRIGVRRDPARGFEAHAWLEHRGEVVLGKLEDLSRYVPLAPFGRRLS